MKLDRDGFTFKVNHLFSPSSFLTVKLSIVLPFPGRRCLMNELEVENELEVVLFWTPP